MKVLLTGATGFVGTRLLVRLLETPTVELVFCLSRDGHLPAHRKVRSIRGDVTSSGWHDKIDEVDVVIHAAANASFGGAADHDAVNREGTVEVIHCARKAGATHFILFSTIGAVDRIATDMVRAPLAADSPPEPRSKYGQSKLLAESAVRDSGLTWTIIRPAWIYGPGMRLNSHLCVLASMARKKSLVSFFNWPGQVSLIHVDDLCRAITEIVVNAGCPNEMIFAATEAVSLGTIFRRFGAASGSAWAGSIPLPARSCRFMISRMHHLLPMTIANLFIDYLTCVTDPFVKWIAPEEPATFQSRFEDVLAVVDPLRKVWLVTGAGGGIGMAIGKLLSKRGVRFIGVDREFSGPPPATASYVTLDLMSPTAVFEIRGMVERENVGVVVNNAGVGFRGPFPSLSPDQVHATISVNMDFPVKCAHAILPLLSKCRGTLVNVASSMGGVPLPGMSLYSASKGFIRTWSLGLAEEVRDTVRVLTVAPTGTNTNFQRSAGVKAGQRTLLDPEDVAAAILRAVSSGRTYCFVGPWPVRLLLFLGGMLPTSLQGKMWGFLFGNLR